MGKESVGKEREESTAQAMEKGTGERMVDTLDVGTHLQCTLTGHRQVCWSLADQEGV